MCPYVTHGTRALQAHDLSGEGINSGSHTYFFDHTGPPQMRDKLNAGPPQRQHKHEIRHTPSMHPFLTTQPVGPEVIKEMAQRD